MWWIVAYVTSAMLYTQRYARSQEEAKGICAPLDNPDHL